MRPASLLLIASLAVSMSAPSAAQESFTKVHGGSGGRQFATRCNPGTVLTGVSTRQGAYVNGIAPICNGTTMKNVGGGGDRSDASCPAGSLVGQMRIVSLRSDNHLLKSLMLICYARNGGQKTADVLLRSPGAFTGGLFTSGYPVGQVGCGRQNATGLQGRAGASIDAIGLICG